MLRITLSLLFSFFLSASAIAGKPLRVGMSADYPPMHYKYQERIVGVEPDNALAVGKFLDREVKLVELPFDQLIPALQAGKIDVIMSGMSITAARGEKVMFADSYLRVGQMAIMHKSKAAEFGQPWSIYREGARIGVEPGTTGEAYAQRELGEAIVSHYDNPDQAFAALRDNKIDMYVHDAPTSWQLANTSDNDDMISLYAPLTEEQLAWAVRHGDHELLNDLNSALATMRASGTLSYILNRWIPVQVEVN